MALRLHTATSLDELLATDVEIFRKPLFDAPQWFVVQNLHLAEWLKLRLARRFGGWAVPEFLLPDMALRRLAEKAAPQPDRTILFLDDLKNLIFWTLRNRDNKGFEKARAYAFRSDGTLDEARLFELADHVAGVFHSYAANSPVILEALEASSPRPNWTQAAREDFAWQAPLWHELFGSGKNLPVGLALSRLAELPALPPVEPRPRLVIFGSAFLGVQAVRFLARWAREDRIEIDQFLLLPGRLDASPATSPARPWGAFGRAFLSSYEGEKLEPSPFVEDSPESKNNLKAIQTALNRQFSFPLPPAASDLPDDSLELVSCVSPLRQLEAFKERLLAALASDPDLKLNDVAFLVPQLEVFEPYLETVFQQEPSLPFNVVDLGAPAEGFFKALPLLLSAYGGKIDRPTVFGLAGFEGFLRAKGVDITAKKLWLEFSDQTATFREDPRQDTATKPSYNSWSWAWTRALDGLVWGSNDHEGFDVHPWSKAIKNPEVLAVLAETIRSWASDARDTAFDTKSLRDWTLWLRDRVNRDWKVGRDEDDAPSRLWPRLLQLSGGSKIEGDPTLGWTGFCAFVKDQVRHFSGRTGRFLTQGFHVASLKPLRALPFRIVGLAGLDENAFPQSDRGPSFDLRRDEPGEADKGYAALDLYTFWETLASTKDRLWLFWRGRDASTGTRLEPSSAIQELRAWAAKAGLTLRESEESVHAFAPPASRGPLVQGFSPRFGRFNAALFRTTGSIAPIFPAPAQEETAFTPQDWGKSLERPARYFARRVLGLWLAEDDETETQEQEPWALGFLERLDFLKKSAQDFLAGGAPETWFVRDVLQGRVAPGLVSDTVFLQAQRVELEKRAFSIAKALASYVTQGARFVRLEVPRETFFAGRGLEGWEDFLEVNENGEVVYILPAILAGKEIKPSHRWKGFWNLAPWKAAYPQKKLAWLGLAEGKTGRPETCIRLDLPNDLDLFRAAEAYADSMTGAPLPFYPDFLEIILKTGEVETAWVELEQKGSAFSEFGSVARCPYARAVFSQPEDLFSVWKSAWNTNAPVLFEPISRLWLNNEGERPGDTEIDRTFDEEKP